MRSRERAVQARRESGMPQARPAYRLRRERLGEWAVAVILLLMGGLWLCWPAGDFRPRAPARLSEPGAAYVVVKGSDSPLMRRPDGLAHGDASGGDPAQGFSLLPPVPAPPLPDPPAYTELAIAPPGLPAPFPRRMPPAPVVAAPPREPLPAARVPRTRFVRLSPALRAAQYRFPMPDALATGEVGRIRFQLLLGADGRVVALLDEEPALADGIRLAWRRALLRGSGVTNASGFVEAEW